MGEHYYGIVKVEGSNPSASTNYDIELEMNIEIRLSDFMGYPFIVLKPKMKHTSGFVVATWELIKTAEHMWAHHQDGDKMGHRWYRVNKRWHPSWYSRGGRTSK